MVCIENPGVLVFNHLHINIDSFIRLAEAKTWIPTEAQNGLGVELGVRRMSNKYNSVPRGKQKRKAR